MRFASIGIVTTLADENIDMLSEKAAEFMREHKLEGKECMRLRLSMEEILLKLRDRFGANERVKMSCYSNLGQPIIRFRVEGDPFDPVMSEDENAWSRRLISDLQTMPLYSYAKNVNSVTFKLVKPKKRATFYLLAALVLAVLVGLLGMLMPEALRMTIANDYIEPICGGFINLLNFCGIPLIFLSVCLAVSGMGDISSLGRIGTKVMGHFMATLGISTALAALIAFPFFNYSFGGAAGVEVAYNDFYKMLFDIFPGDFFSAFTNASALQLIVIGIAFGVALIKLDPLAKHLSGFLDDINGTFLLFTEWVMKVMPIFVFCTILKSVWAGRLNEILPMWKPFVIALGVEVLIVLIYALQIVMKKKISLGLLWRKVSGTVLIAVGTNSCGATIPEMYTAADKMGVQGNHIGFGIPIGTSVFKPALAARLIVVSFFMASVYQVGVSVEWFILAVLMAFIFSIAVPAIPGGALLFYPMLFSQLGIPAGAMALVLATDFFFDCICTALCMVSTELALVQQADKMEMLDEKKLKAE